MLPPSSTGVVADDLDSRWLKRLRPAGTPAGDVTLFCFHHAGGSATVYRAWGTRLEPAVDPVAVQLPGRADRFNEDPYDRFPPLVDAVVETLTPMLDRPFAFYGASMGARLAWAVTLRLRELTLPLPVRLFLACEPGPWHDDGSRPWEAWPGGLPGYMRDLGGTPPEVLAQPEVVSILLPTLRADLVALTTAPGRPDTPLDIPIHAFAGTTDEVAPPARMAAWADETSAGFVLELVPGSHFFDEDGEWQVLRAISRDLRRPLAGGAGRPTTTDLDAATGRTEPS